MSPAIFCLATLEYAVVPAREREEWAVLRAQVALLERRQESMKRVPLFFVQEVCSRDLLNVPFVET